MPIFHVTIDGLLGHEEMDIRARDKEEALDIADEIIDATHSRSVNLREWKRDTVMGNAYVTQLLPDEIGARLIRSALYEYMQNHPNGIPEEENRAWEYIAKISKDMQHK
jgi:hypothetical protein